MKKFRLRLDTRDLQQKIRTQAEEYVTDVLEQQDDSEMIKTIENAMLLASITTIKHIKERNNMI
jgi:hypothetical protein